MHDRSPNKIELFSQVELPEANGFFRGIGDKLQARVGVNVESAVLPNNTVIPEGITAQTIAADTAFEFAGNGANVDSRSIWDMSCVIADPIFDTDQIEKFVGDGILHPEDSITLQVYKDFVLEAFSDPVLLQFLDSNLLRRIDEIRKANSHLNGESRSDELSTFFFEMREDIRDAIDHAQLIDFLAKNGKIGKYNQVSPLTSMERILNTPSFARPRMGNVHGNAHSELEFAKMIALHAVIGMILPVGLPHRGAEDRDTMAKNFIEYINNADSFESTLKHLLSGGIFVEAPGLNVSLSDSISIRLDSLITALHAMASNRNKNPKDFKAKEILSVLSNRKDSSMDGIMTFLSEVGNEYVSHSRTILTDYFNY
jgi:hypothetical protein